jgi:hypothetical protein
MFKIKLDVTNTTLDEVTVIIAFHVFMLIFSRGEKRKKETALHSNELHPRDF